MHCFFNKKTLMGLIGLLAVLSLIAYPAESSRVVAEGGTKNYLPLISVAGISAASGETTIYGTNATWKYFDKGTLPAPDWFSPSFNDGSWASGSAPLGYGEGGERTLISYGSSSSNKYITYYFRKLFTVADAASFTSLIMDISVDDGAVFYLNGKEVYRHNMPSGTIDNATLASSAEDGDPRSIKMDPRALVNGTNVFAVEVHQASTSSSDVWYSLALHGMAETSGPAPTATAVPPAATAPAPTTAPTSQPTLPPTSGKTYYVTTSGSSSGDGSSTKPWSLAHAFSHPSALKPGDTVWVRGGTYSGDFTLKIDGTSSAPITVRAYPGERVTIRHSSAPVIDLAGASYVNLWGLEITSSYSKRSESRSESTYGIRVNQGTESHHVKLINMVIHDVQAQGIGWWQALKDTEIYGSLWYFNGTTQLDHGVYVHNTSGNKYLIDNMIFDNASHGLHGYAETAEKGLNNITVEGNTFFNNGSVGYTTTKETYGIYKRNILLGGLTVAKNPVISNNYAYYPGSSGESLNLGYNAGSSGARITNNYLAGGLFKLGGSNTSLSISGNYVYAPAGFSGVTTSKWPENTWTRTKPADMRVFVRPNRYESNRANITIFNWSRQSTVSVSASTLSGVSLKVGDRYELHNAQNFYGDVITGTYDGTSIKVPMTGRSVAQPVGLSFKPDSTFPEFGAFVLIVTK